MELVCVSVCDYVPGTHERWTRDREREKEKKSELINEFERWHSSKWREAQRERVKEYIKIGRREEDEVEGAATNRINVQHTHTQWYSDWETI